MYSNNYGLNDNFEYLELALDSTEALTSVEPVRVTTGNVPVLDPSTNKIYDYPLFEIAGRQPLRNIAAIKVLEVQIPFTWYTLTPPNNTFVLRVVGAGITTVTITIPAGNYSTAALCAKLNSLCSSTATGAYTNVLWQFNEVTGKLEVALDLVPAPGFNWFRLDFSSSEILGKMMGIEGIQTYYPNTDQQYFSFYQVAQLSGPNYLYLNSNALGPNVNMYQPRTSPTGGNSGPQIAKIPINVSPGGIIYWQDPDPQKWFSADNLDTLINLDMYISLGKSTTPIALNGAGFSVKLGILLWNTDAPNYVQGNVTMGRRQ